MYIYDFIEGVMLKIRRFVIILIVISISNSFLNCQSDKEISFEYQGVSKVRRISLNDFRNHVGEKNYFSINTYFDITRQKNSNENFRILVDNIVMIQKENKTFYTFQIEKQTSENEFYNLVLTVDNQQQVTKSEVLKYVRESSSSNDSYFEGTVQAVSDFTIHHDDLISQKANNDCIVSAYGVWECSFGNTGDDHAPGMCNGTSSHYTIHVIYEPCPTTPELVDVDSGAGNTSDDSGTSGGGATNPNDDDNTTETVPLDDETALDRIIECMNGAYNIGGNNVTMPQSLLDSLTSRSANSFCLNKLDNFLNTEGCGNQEKLFGIEAARACLKGEEVNYEHRIIIDSTMMEHPCHAKIIKSTFNSSAAIVQLVKNAFNDDTKFTYRIKATAFPAANSNESAFTDPFPTCTQGNCTVKTEFNKAYFVTSSDLIIARNAIHESVHAVLAYLFQTGLLQTQSSDPDFTELVVAYTTLQASSQADSQQSGQDLNNIQHEFMTGLIDVLALALKSYGDSKGYILPLSYYKKLTWASSSMIETPNFENEFSYFQRLEIIAIGLAELQGTSQTYLINQNDEVTIPPNGVIPNTTEPCN
ncbi:hypothetical protein C8N46_106129 [Kordia periserrulae]|uniref:Uncharacterized protein n=1 Tax=Kordia periserrulae TaxID=701523 RepID=A0A2T6BWN1_9FLAO|nr:hypothetical protein [Kordia periserrulae]PTX60485.1 hypothetical protein C8N46_106129 [Kordia periserrulae]